MRRLLSRHPCLAVAERASIGLLHTAGAGFHFAANLLARHAPWSPEWLDLAGVLILGMSPYLAIDTAWRRWRAARRLTA